MCRLRDDGSGLSEYVRVLVRVKVPMLTYVDRCLRNSLRFLPPWMDVCLNYCGSRHASGF